MLLLGNLGPDGHSYLDDAINKITGRAHEAVRADHRFNRLNITNEATLTGGENVGGADVSSSSEVNDGGGGDGSGGDGDGDGDGDPEPERRPCSRNPSNTLPAASTRQRCAAPPNALINFPLLPDDAHVRLPVVMGLYTCSSATVWRRVKSGLIPAPRRLSERITAWRVGDLRAALASLSQ